MIIRPKLLFINACGSLEGDINVAVTALANFAPETFEVHVVSVPRGRAYEKFADLPAVRMTAMEMGGSEGRLPQRTGRAWELFETATAVPRLVALVLREKIDIIYTIDRTVATYLGLVVSKLTRRPFVVCAAYPFYPQHSALNRLVIRQATRIQVHSEYLRRHWEPYSASPEQFVTILDAIQVENYNPAASGEGVRRDLGIPPAAPIVLLPGRVDRYKGHEDLLTAAALVLRERPDTHFVIAGRPNPQRLPYGEREMSIQAIIEDMIASGHMADRVHLVGYYPDLPGLMAAATIITMPSWEEPFGLVALEGMAVGKPVVATDAGGVPEFVTHGEVGLLVPPRDPAALAGALLTLINDPEHARKMGLAGRRRVERRHTAQIFNEAVTKLLHDVLPRVTSDNQAATVDQSAVAVPGE